MAIQLNKNQKEALSSYLSMLHQKYEEQILMVILFGSVVRGVSDIESDIDLLIVTANGDQNLRDEISMACFDIILKTDVILSPLVMDKEIYEWHENYHDPLYNLISR